VVIIAGAGSNNTAEVIEKVRAVATSGADAALVVGPYYNKPTQAGYFAHFSAIADAVDIPLMIYNVPGRTGGNITAETLLRMAEEIPSIRMVKEASGNMTQIMEIARNKPKNFALFSGDDALTFPMMALGADGCVSVVSNEAPKAFSHLVRLCLEGKWEQARALHFKLLPLMQVNFIESSPGPVKTAMAMMGLLKENFRLPMVPIAPAHREALQSILKQLNLIA
jgi:4-hydroxy-tetrahydrodipicolinate synthase